MKEAKIQEVVSRLAARSGVLHHTDTIGLLGSARRGALARLLGARKGWPDMVFLPPGGSALWVELKGPRTAVSPEQKELHETMIALGYRVAVVRSATGEDAWKKIKSLL